MALILLEIMNSVLEKFNELNISSKHEPLQRLSLPEPILYYIAKNPPSPKLYQKLIQTCKYFFIKNPIIVLRCLTFDDKDGWKTCSASNDSCSKAILRKLDIKKFSYKIWITRYFFINSTSNSKMASWFIQNKLFRHESTAILRLQNQSISFNELIPNYSLCKSVYLLQVSIKCQNGSETTVDKVLSNFPKVSKFFFYNDAEIYPSNLVENLLKIPHFSNIGVFKLFNVSDFFDFEKFYAYLKKNTKMVAILQFNDTISQQYRNRLSEVITEILKISPESDEFIPLYIRYPGQDPLILEKLHKNVVAAYQKM